MNLNTLQQEGATPLASCKFPIGKTGTLQASLFGGCDPAGRDFDWSLKNALLKQGCEIEHKELVRRLRLIDGRAGVNAWYAPVPTEFNGLILETKELTHRISLNSEHSGVWRGKNADGVVLPRHTGFLLSTGGCPIILATDGKRVCVAHAGLRSLVRWNDAEREFHVSVVKNIANQFPDPDEVQVRVLFAIAPERYEHASQGKYAADTTDILHCLYDGGFPECIKKKGPGVSCIDMICLIKAQVTRAGMRFVTDHSNSFLPEAAYDTRLPAPLNSYRNLIAVTFT